MTCKVPVLAACALAFALPGTALAEDNDGSDNRDLQRSIYQTLRGDYYGPAYVEGGYVMQGRASASEPPPSEPRTNEWQRYEQTNTPFDMEPATRPQD